MLRDIIAESHNHLRESHKKRDQLVAFYMALLGASIAFRNTEKWLTELILVLLLFGIGVLWALIQYRRWHLIYNGAIAALERACTRDDADEKALTLEAAEQLWYEVNPPMPVWAYVNPFRGVENATTVLASVGVSAALYLFLTISTRGWPPPFGGAVVAAVVDVIVVVTLTFVVLAVHVPGIQQFPTESWMFRWLRTSTDRASRGWLPWYHWAWYARRADKLREKLKVGHTDTAV